MSWKQIKIFTADAEQSVVIEPNPEKDGMVMHSIEEHDNESFMLHMTFEEAETIGQELIKYAEEIKSNVVGQSKQLVCDYEYHNRDIITNGECTKCESHKWKHTRFEQKERSEEI